MALPLRQTSPNAEKEEAIDDDACIDSLAITANAHR